MIGKRMMRVGEGGGRMGFVLFPLIILPKIDPLRKRGPHTGYVTTIKKKIKEGN